MSNTIRHKGRFVTVVFDGSTNFNLCAFLGVKAVTLMAISQLSVAVNDTLTVWWSSNKEVEIYGPYVDVTGGGKLREYEPFTCTPYVTGSEATAGSKASFEIAYVKE